MKKITDQPVEWKSEDIPLSELIGKEWADNPRISTEEDLDGLDDSWQSFGQVETVAIAPDGSLYNGHQRLKYLTRKGYAPDYLVAVRRASRPLSEEEKHKLTLYLHAGATGRWNWKKLDEWPKEELQQYGFGKNFQERMMTDYAKVMELFGDDAPEDADSTGGNGEPLPDERSDGTLLELLNVTIDEPKHQVETGQVWRAGPHVLLCVNVLTDWQIWVKYLKGDAIFAPYPGPFVPLSKIAGQKKIVMVQPDPYIAGHILDSFEEINGPGSVRLEK